MQRINTPDAPAAVGPYSQGVVTGDFLFTAGQIALTPDGELKNATVEEETRQIMVNLQAILSAANCRFADVVMVRIHITAKDIFPEINRIYAEYFPENETPARECVVAAPPLEGAHVEISMVAELAGKR